MLTNMYVFYVKKVFHGIDVNKTNEIGWFYPEKCFIWAFFRLTDPNLLSKNENLLFSQYYKLREALKKYRAIEQNGDWTPIDIDTVDYYKHNDSAKAIGQIRHRLATGEI
jgi:hypothetical protein